MQKLCEKCVPTKCLITSVVPSGQKFQISSVIRILRNKIINIIFKCTASSIHQAEMLPKLLKHQHCFTTSKNCRVTERSMDIGFLTHSCNISNILCSVESQGEAVTTQNAPSFPWNSLQAKLVIMPEALNSSGFPRIKQHSQGTEET